VALPQFLALGKVVGYPVLGGQHQLREMKVYGRVFNLLIV